MMSAAALAGGVRRSWKLLGRMVVWQLQRSSTMPSGMQSIMSSNTTTTATSCLSGVTIENSFLNSVSSLSWAGVPGKTSSSIKLSNVRVAGSSSSAPWSGKEEKEEEQQGTNTGEEAERVDKAADNRDKSNYWGVTTKTHYREDGTKWPWKSFRPSDTYSPNYDIDLHKHREPNRWEEKLALRVVQLIKIPTVWFYRSRYGCRAMMLETVAAVPGMVGGMQLHLRSLRRFEQSGGWIKALLDEAENERMHLMTLMELVQPAWYERGLVVTTQGIFFGCYSLLYLMSPRLAHRVTGYLEEEAIISYSTYLDEIDKGNVDNVPAPAIAIDYWKLPKDARLREVILALRADEAHHRDVNHYAADVRVEGKQLHDAPAPIDYR